MCPYLDLNLARTHLFRRVLHDQPDQASTWTLHCCVVDPEAELMQPCWPRQTSLSPDRFPSTSNQKCNTRPVKLQLQHHLLIHPQPRLELQHGATNGGSAAAQMQCQPTRPGHEATNEPRAQMPPSRVESPLQFLIVFLWAPGDRSTHSFWIRKGSVVVRRQEHPDHVDVAGPQPLAISEQPSSRLSEEETSESQEFCQPDVHHVLEEADGHRWQLRQRIHRL